MYFRTSLIGLAWLIIASLSQNVDPQNSNDSRILMIWMIFICLSNSIDIYIKPKIKL